MKKRTIFLLTISMLLVLAFVQVALVSAEEACEGEECGYTPPDEYVCDDPEGCPEEDPYTEPDPDPDPGDGYWCADGVWCEYEQEEVVDECENGNPGNAKCVGKAGEKEEMGGFYPPPPPNEDVDDGEYGAGTHGRSDPDKHKPHPSVPPAE
jgi:hypothetical protein